MDRPKRKVAKVDYNKLNNFGTSGIDDMAFEFIFQKMANSNSDELQLHADEDDMLDLMSDDESNKLNEAAALFHSTLPKTSQQVIGVNKAIDELSQNRRKHSDSKSQKVVLFPGSILRGNSSTESESETSSTSSSEDSSDYELSAKLSSKKMSKKLKSVLKLKSADKYEYVSKDGEFKQLNFKILVAGELEIINNFCKNKSEKERRLKLSQKVAYFSSIYHWASVLEFYAAWLRLIELGRKTWSADSQMLENVMLSGQSYGAVLGPFASNQFNDHLVISPLNSVPKANSEERRVIMDLSFPKGKSVNDGIDKNVYLGKHIELHYLNVDNFIEIIKEKDDFAGAEIGEKADISYKKLKWVLDSCGLEESVEKASSPSHRMSFLGVWFDTEKMTMEVTPDRLVKVFDFVLIWLNKDTAFLKEVQSLIGKLNFIASCVRPGRIFISRILNFLREFKNEDCILDVSLELKHHLLWWSEFLEIYDGVSLLNLQEWTEPDEYMASDACLVGCGGVSNGQFFHCVFQDFHCFGIIINYCLFEVVGTKRQKDMHSV
ncbi:unnamed protein product [Mytilus coruscus]|uniref:Uncharacterized protein n=1 Tax=Mytilus coruscus TaxID=42192 RepID=A0A6J8C624_MYTCO|nr:unnamed protein product [Mytilus coruscus]